jgi:hypothetical protein
MEGWKGAVWEEGGGQETEQRLQAAIFISNLVGGATATTYRLDIARKERLGPCVNEPIIFVVFLYPCILSSPKMRRHFMPLVSGDSIHP